MIEERTETISRNAEAESTRGGGTAALLERGSGAQSPTSSEAENKPSPLFPGDELENLRHRWQDVQGSFVDDPRSAVRNADELVASVMTRLAQVFAEERGKLEHEWDKGESVSTEDLRVALRRYRAFFDRLLSV
jgi:hypothetical protein